MTLSEVSIRNPVFAWMLMFGLILFGALSFQLMGVSQMPNVDFPVVNIALRLDNAAPEVMEINVVDIIEDAVMGIEGLRTVSSSVSQGIANITCEFALNHNIDVALQEVVNRIDQVNNLLPTSLYPPVVTKTNPEDQPILWVMLSATPDIPLYKQMIYARNTLKDQFSTINGVGDIQLGGYVEPNLRVWLHPEKLKAYNLNSQDVWSAIQLEQIEQPAGRIEAKENEINIRILGEEITPEAFGKIRINERAGSPNFHPIPLSDVATIEMGIADKRAMARFNGLTTVGLGVVKQHGANAVAVAKLIRAKVNAIRPHLLKGYQLDVRLDSTKFIEDSVNELTSTLVVAAILTSLVCFLFLGSWSSTINVMFAIPTSVVGSFIVLRALNFTLNTFTLLGLALAIGIVVDDAIMMLENIVRHYEMNKTRFKAALDGSIEITFAAIATTFAIAAIFIPVVFMDGIVGRFFYQYGVTVTVAVFLSLLEALTLTPMRCASFMQTNHEAASQGVILRTMNRFMTWLEESYKKVLKVCLAHRLKVIAVSLAFFFGSLGLVPLLRQELIPAQDQSLFLLTVRLDVNASINLTDRVFAQVEDYLKARPDVENYYVNIGNYSGNNVVNMGTAYVILKQPSQRTLSQRQIMDQVRADVKKMLPHAVVFSQDLSLTGFSASKGYPIEFSLQGPNWERLKELEAKFTQRLKESDFLEDLNTDYQEGMPQIQIIPDRQKAAQFQVSVSAIGQEVENMIGGQIFNSTTQYPLEGHRYYIRVRSAVDAHKQIKDIENIMIHNNLGAAGEMIALKDVARIELTHAPQLITRLNRERAIPMFANVKEGKSQQAALLVVEKIAHELLPESEGYQVLITGGAAAFREAFSSLIFALILGIAVAYMVLASQFNSFIHPVTILLALPFSLSGAWIGLYLAHQSLSLYSMIGLILLLGIVKKNSILLVDFTNQQRALGFSPLESLMNACPIRLRPILMTSIATVTGAIPEALNFGAGAETRVPMAIALIGGVTLSTLLTLIVVPCFYSLMTRFERPSEEPSS